jgi:hypothetical protein
MSAELPAFPQEGQKTAEVLSIRCRSKSLIAVSENARDLFRYAPWKCWSPKNEEANFCKQAQIRR